MDDIDYCGSGCTTVLPPIPASHRPRTGHPAQTARNAAAGAVMVLAGSGLLLGSALILVLDSSSRSNGGYAGMPERTGLVGLRYTLAYGSGWLAALLLLAAVILAAIPPRCRWAALGPSRCGAVGRVVAAQMAVSIAGVMLLPG